MIYFLANDGIQDSAFANQLPTLRYIGNRKWTFDGLPIGRRDLGSILAGFAEFNTGNRPVSVSAWIADLERVGTFVCEADPMRLEAFVKGFVIPAPGFSVTGERLYRVWKTVFGKDLSYSESDLLWAMRDVYDFKLNAQWGRTVLDARLCCPNDDEDVRAF